jgi:hypothetical protein
MLKQDVEILEANLKESPYIQIISNLPENAKPKDAPPPPNPQQPYRDYDNPGGYQQPGYNPGYEQYGPGKMNPGAGLAEHDPQLHKQKYSGYYPGYTEQVAPGPMTGPPGKHQPQLPQQQYYMQQGVEDYQQPYEPQEDYLEDPNLEDQGYRPVPPQYKGPGLKHPTGAQGYQGGPNQPPQYPINPNPQQYHPQGKPYEHPAYPQYSEHPNPRYPAQPIAQSSRKSQLQPSQIHPAEQPGGPMIQPPYIPKPAKEKLPPQPFNPGYESMDPYRHPQAPPEHYRQEQPGSQPGMPYYPKKKEHYSKADYRPEYDEYGYEQPADDYSGYYPADSHQHYYKQDKSASHAAYAKADRSDRQSGGYDRKRGSFHQGQHSGSRGEGSQQHGPHSADHSQHSQNQPQSRRTGQSQTVQPQAQLTPPEKAAKEPATAKAQSSKKEKVQLQPALNPNTKLSASKQKPANFEDNVMDSTPSISKPTNPVISSLSSVSSPTSHPQPAQSSTSPVDPPASDTLASTPDVKFIDDTAEKNLRKPGFNRDKKKHWQRKNKFDSHLQSGAQAADEHSVLEHSQRANQPNCSPATIDHGLNPALNPAQQNATRMGGTFHFNESSDEELREFQQHRSDVDSSDGSEEHKSISESRSSEERCAQVQLDLGPEPALEANPKTGTEDLDCKQQR